MIFSQWSMTLQESFNNLLWATVNFLPNLVLAIIIFVIGWFLGVLIGRVIEQAVRAIKVDHALKAAGVEEVVNRAGWQLNSGVFIGALVKWFIIIVFLLAALSVMGLTSVTLFLQLGLLPYLARVIVAVLIIAIAAVIAEVAQSIVTGSARAAGVSSAGFAGTVAKWAIWIFAILAALDQLGVTPFVQTIFTGVVVALSIAFGLAFGLGGQEAASRFIERTRNDMQGR
jgi:mechanosensitive ion channel-like protein